MRVSIAILSFAISICTCGCTTSSSTGTIPKIVLNPLDTPSNRPDILLSGGLSGRLTVHQNCVVLSKYGAKITPLWPVGTILNQAGKRLQILLPDQRGQSKIGNRVKLSGAKISSDDTSIVASLPPGCPSSQFVVSRID